MTEVFAEQALFDGAGGGDGCGESELLGTIGAIGGDGGDVQHAGEIPEGIENRCPGAGEFAVARAKMLAAVDEQGALFGDACANAVCALNLLRPDAAQPDAPTLEIIGPCLIAPMVNRNSRAVAQEDYVALLANDGVETIDLFPCVDDDVCDRFF